MELKLKEVSSEPEQPMVHCNIAVDTVDKMLEARKQLEDAILKYEPIIDRLEELWETKVNLLLNIGNLVHAFADTEKSSK